MLSNIFVITEESDRFSTAWPSIAMGKWLWGYQTFSQNAVLSVEVNKQMTIDDLSPTHSIASREHPIFHNQSS
jgi:hypothetical protein